ncbi:MAG: DUF2237 family protein [Bdellovibrionia bacterium]
MLLLTLLPIIQASFAWERNVTHTRLKKCGHLYTGFYRNGYCLTGPEDQGTHVACATVTQEFLNFTKSQGNDLITPRPEVQFPGLKAGDQWCLCALRWKEAKEAGVSPPLDLQATHRRMLDFLPMKELRK